MEHRMRLNSAAAAFMGFGVLVAAAIIGFAMLAAAAIILMSHALTLALARLATAHRSISGSRVPPMRGDGAPQYRPAPVAHD